MARVVHAISREEVQDGPSVAGLQLYAAATLVLNVHFEQIQQPDPLRVYVRSVGVIKYRGSG